MPKCAESNFKRLSERTLVSLTFFKKLSEKNRHFFRKFRETNIYSKSFLKFDSAHAGLGIRLMPKPKT